MCRQSSFSNEWTFTDKDWRAIDTESTIVVVNEASMKVAHFEVIDQLINWWHGYRRSVSAWWLGAWWLGSSSSGWSPSSPAAAACVAAGPLLLQTQGTAQCCIPRTLIVSTQVAFSVCVCVSLSVSPYIFISFSDKSIKITKSMNMLAGVFMLFVILSPELS